MNINWTQTGAPVMQDEGISREHVQAVIDRLEWQEIPKNGTLEVAMGPGLAIKAAIKEFHMPKVSHVAVANDLAPYGFYGIRAHYSNGDVDVFILDLGTELVALRSDFTPKEVNVSVDK